MKKIRLLYLFFFLSFFSFNVNAQKEEEFKFEVDEELKGAIENIKSSLSEKKDKICSEVKDLSSKAGAVNNGGVMQYSNYVEFVNLANRIDELNNEWNEYYGNLMDKLIDKIKSNNSCNSCNNFKDDRGYDLLFDELEENHIIFPDDIASVCFEDIFNFQSFRQCINEGDEAYLNETGEEFDAGKTPSNQEELEDEEFWTLINCNKEFTVLTQTIDDGMFVNGETESEKKDLLSTIKDVLGVLGQTVNIVKELGELFFTDCAPTDTGSERDIRFGLPFNNGNNSVGYVIRQRGVYFEFKKTTTRIKGKAKLWKKNKRGKFKKDRRAVAGIMFCGLEWEGCSGKEWLNNGQPYIQDPSHKRKKVKIRRRFDGALQIKKSTHYLQFKFFKDRNYIGDKILLGNQRCD